MADLHATFRHEIDSLQARVAELADAHGSGPCPRKWVEVQILSRVLATEHGCPKATERRAVVFFFTERGCPKATHADSLRFIAIGR